MDKDTKKLIEEILSKYMSPKKNKAFVFGSRATDNHAKYSDIDIGIEGEPLEAETYFEIQNELEETDLPVRADLVEFRDVSDNFKTIAKNQIIQLEIR